jgi:hypothetical protein
MTANEMKYHFQLMRDRLANFDAPDINDNEISLLLSKAEERFLLQNYSGTNRVRESFEETEKRRKDLSNLVTTAQITTPSSNQTNTLPNGLFFDLPDNVLFVISEHIVATSENPCVNNKHITVVPITHDQYESNKHNPFKKPNEEKCWRLDYKINPTSNQRRHEIITGNSYTIATYFFRYISKLPGIVVDTITPGNQVNSVLDDSTHMRIVDIAVELSLESLKDERLQTNLIINTKNE